MSRQIHEELNRLRLIIKELVEVNMNMMDRIERLERANRSTSVDQTKNPPGCAT